MSNLLLDVRAVVLVIATVMPAAAQTFDSPPVPAPFSQEVWASDADFMGGVAFAPDGDVWVTDCVFSGGILRRFDAQTTILVSGTPVHPLVGTVVSSTGCGLTNHPDGFLYSNTSLGVTRQRASTGMPAGGPFGPPGDALGITVHPVTGEIVYVGSGGQIFGVDKDFTTSRTVSLATAGSFVDGIFFEPSGTFLLTATRSGPGGFRVSVIRYSDGSLVQEVLLASEPDGIAFHASTPKFVLTNNTDGTITRIDFPGDDFTQPGVPSPWAGGGFRGDLSQVGADGCLYLTQDGTHFDNGTETSSNSIVRICPDFAPPAGVSQIVLAPIAATNLVGESHTVTATVKQDGNPLAGAVTSFEVISGPHAGLNGTDTTDALGEATFTYIGTTPGTDTLQASFVAAGGAEKVSNTVTKEWLPVPILEIDNGCSGSFGVPQLSVTSTLIPGTAVALDLTSALPSSPAILMVGFEPANLVREGCTLLFHPVLNKVLLTNALGEFHAISHWQGGLPSGLEIFLQAYLIDAGAPTGFASSNTVKITTP